MIPDISYTPKRDKKLPAIILSCLFAVLILCCICLMFHWWREAVFQAIFIICAVGIVFVFVRFFKTQYTYTINYEDKLFLVTQRDGKRLTTLCRLDLFSLYRIRPYEEDDNIERHHADRYSFCVNIFPEKTYLAFFDDGEHIVSLRMEFDDRFYTLLCRVAEQYEPREEEDYVSPDSSDPGDTTEQ